MSRRLAIVRTFSLADVAPEWDDCFIKYIPATIAQLKELSEADAGNSDLSDADAALKVAERAGDFFVSGRVKVLNDQGDVETVEATKDDLAILPPLVLRDLYMTCLGVATDPKDSVQAVKPADPQDATELPSPTS